MTLQYPRDERRALNCSTVQRAPFITADFKNFRRETMEGEMDGDGNRGGDNNRRRRGGSAVAAGRHTTTQQPDVKTKRVPSPFLHGVTLMAWVSESRTNLLS